MAIQFACPACQQPIEVDDEWADQTVSCPYCRRVVRAPAQSTLQLGAIPAASQPVSNAPVPPPTGPNAAPPPPPRFYADTERGEPVPPAPQPRGPNPLATWSVILGVLAWGLIVMGAQMLMPIIDDVMEQIPSTRPSDERSEVQRQAQLRFQQLLADDATTRKRAGVAMLLLLGAEACGLTGLILGLVGATRRDAKKGASVAGIIINGVFLSGQCGLLISALVLGD